MNIKTNEICPLCNQKKNNIRKSHIVPKFVGKYQKKAAIGNIRNTYNPNIPSQDIFKEYLLCGECEELFSKYETWFAENIFKPYKNQQVLNSPNTSSSRYKLKYFLTSVAWRFITVYKNDIVAKINNPALSESFENAFDEMRKLLVNDNEKIEKLKYFKVFLMYFPEKIEIPYPKDAEKYIPKEAWRPNTLVHQGIMPYVDINNTNGIINILINMMGIAVNCYIMDIPDRLNDISQRYSDESEYKAIVYWIAQVCVDLSSMTENSQNKLKQKFEEKGLDVDDPTKPIIRDWINDILLTGEYFHKDDYQSFNNES